MKSHKYLIGFLVYPIGLLMVSCQTTPLPPCIGDAQCGYIAEKRYINILTINLLFSEVDDRNDRMKAVAHFAANSDSDSEFI
jgi:hypothetical protein